MDIGDFLNKAYDNAVEFGKDCFMAGTVGACGAYLVSSLAGTNRAQTAKATAIYFIIRKIFLNCFEENKKRNLFGDICDLFGGLTFTAYLYNNDLASRTATIVLSCMFGGSGLLACYNRYQD